MTHTNTGMSVDDIIAEIPLLEDTMEGRFLKRKLIRSLYNGVGDIKPSDIERPEKVFGHACSFNRHNGYTTYICTLTREQLKERMAGGDVRSRVNKMSNIKERITREYAADGWNALVQPFNVICTKIVKHTRYDKLWVEFYVSRDCSKYQLVIETD